MVVSEVELKKEPEIITFNNAFMTIKKKYGFNEKQLADIMDCSPAAIVTYQNNTSAVPYKRAKLLDIFLNQNNDSVYNYIFFEDDDQFYYHGSRNGIFGKIDWKYSRRDSGDFGKGFYLGESFMQSSTFIAGEKNSLIYKFKFKKESLNIKELSPVDPKYKWFLYVAYNRKKINDMQNANKIIDKMHNLSKNQDAIYGPIADDKMSLTMDNFLNDGCTTQQLIKCLTALRIGNQFCLKSDKATECLELVTIYKLDNTMHNLIRDFAMQNTNSAVKEAKEISNENSDGKRFSEIVKEVSNE